MTTTNATSTVYLFDLLCPRERYRDITALHFVGGGGATVDVGTIRRRTDPTYGEPVVFSNRDGGGMVLLRTICGVTLLEE